MNHQLKHVAHLIKTNQRVEAHQALVRYMEEQPLDAYAWYLFSFTMPQTHEKLTAAQHALALNPTSEKLQGRVAQLQQHKTRTTNRFKISLFAAVVGITMIAVLGAALISPRLQPSSRQLPTQVALAVSTSTVIPTQEAIATEMGIRPEAQQAILTASSMPQESSPVVNIPSTPMPAASVTPVVEEDIALSQTRVDPAVIPVLAATAAPLALSSDTVTTVPEATVAAETPVTSVEPTPVVSVPSATAAPIEPTPPTVIITDNGVPMNTALDIGIGEMRVINATRSAESYIQGLGGVMPSAPINQSWVLVELLVICQSKNVCTADPSHLDIVGSSGAAYSASPQLNMTPILGSATSNGQIWGYVGFVIPNSESQLRLVLSEGSQSHIFALQ